MRSIYLDNLKGFLIILVVLGHTLQTLLPNYDQNILFRIIYSFHMPMFFFISGILNFRTTIEQSVLQRRAKSLLIPYFFYIILYHFLGKTPLTWQEQLFEPSNGLWFLWILFLCIIITYAIEKLSNSFKIKAELGFIIGFGILNIVKLFSDNIFGVGLLTYHYFYFLLGFIYKKFDLEIDNYIRKFWMFSLVLFPLFAYYWTRVGDPLFYSFLNLGLMFVKFYKYLTALCGIIFFFSIFKFFIIKEIYGITNIGKVTLGIYFIHFWLLSYLPAYVIQILRMNANFIGIIVIFLLSIFGSIGLIFLIKKNKYIASLILGI